MNYFTTESDDMKKPAATYEMLLGLLGEKGTVNMCEAYGGHTIRIPKKIRDDGLKSVWVTLFGKEGMEKLCAHFSGDLVYIPKNKAGQIKARNEHIVSRLRNGIPVRLVAEEFQISERQVYVIFGKARTTESASGEPANA